MLIRAFLISMAILYFIPQSVRSQHTEKIVFNPGDSTNDFYLAIPPQSGNIQGVQVLLTCFFSPENVLIESKLPNVAYGNDLLTVIVSLKTSMWADSSTVERINLVIKDVVRRYSADTSKFVFGGFIYAGDVALRYTELCYEKPSGYPLLPKAVFAADCPVDLLSLSDLCEREISKNYFPGSVEDGKFILKAMTDNIGAVSEHREKYILVSPFTRELKVMGNEQYLKRVPVRLYYDTDIVWELKTRRNSYFDTFIPDGSEFINRLLLAGNSEAEFVPSRLPGMRTNGMRNPHSWSVIDEVDCIQWIKQKLKIFNPQTFVPPYQLPVPDGWSVERFSLPPDFARQITYKGLEDIRFSPGFTDQKNENYWSYAYLWWLDGNPEISAAAIQNNLASYYSGLIERNISIRKIPTDKLFPTVVSIHPVKTDTEDSETFAGTIHMLDYLTQTPMILNAVIHKKNCSDKNHGFLFFEISPKEQTHPVWQKMNKLYQDLQCVKP
jgi:hypothetical protein